jgi:hypothetical protein
VLDPNNQRPYDVLTEIVVQREILPRVAVNFAYANLRTIGLLFTENTAVPFTEYSTLDIADPRQNGQMIPVFNLNPSMVGRQVNIDRTSENNRAMWQGFDLTLDARFGSSGTLLAGMSSGQTVLRRRSAADLVLCDRAVERTGSLYYERNNQLDTSPRATIVSQINTFGPTLDRIQSALNPRYVRFGVKVDF